ncbi:sigma-70 family RNA polymerase sigma factor [Limibacter armeniacum]|uniref:RNA polymerase sigma factor n=1 Tax=Limibacter armeniacum TaxID=466084 RepID=UPI002FE56A71
MIKENDLESFSVAKLKANDRKEWERLYLQYRSLVIRIVRKKGGTEEDGIELYHSQVMPILKNNLEQGKIAEDTNFGAYINTITHRRWSTEAVKLQKAPKAMAPEELPIHHLEESDESTELEESLLQVESALEKMDSPCQQLIKARYFEGKRDKELADTLNKKPNAIANQRKRCMDKLKKMIIENI